MQVERYQPTLNLGYIHEMFNLDIWRGDLNTTIVFEDAKEPFAYRAGKQFAERDMRTTANVTVTRILPTGGGKQLCDCWVWEPWHLARRFEHKEGECTHHLDYGYERFEVPRTHSLAFNPVTHNPWLRGLTNTQLHTVVACMRGYGIGFYDGTYDKKPDSHIAKAYMTHHVFARVKHYFLREYQRGLAEGAEYGAQHGLRAAAKPKQMNYDQKGAESRG